MASRPSSVSATRSARASSRRRREGGARRSSSTAMDSGSLGSVSATPATSSGGKATWLDLERLQTPRAAVQSVDRRDDRAQAADPGREGGAVAAQMLPEERVARPQHGVPVGLVLRLDREIALGVEAHRAVRQIGRSDEQQPIVDDQQLGMHVDRRSAGRRLRRSPDAGPAAGRSGRPRADGPGTGPGRGP